MGEQRLSGEFLILADNEQFYRLARLRVGHTDRRALQHARMHDDDRFDLVRIHVETGDENHVFLAIDDAHETAVVHHADVAGGQPAICIEHLRRLVGSLPVTRHHLRPLDADLARLPQRHVVTRVVTQYEIGRWDREPDRAVVLLKIERIYRRRRRCLGQAVRFDQRHAGDLLPSLGNRLLHRHAAAQRQAQRREIQPRKIGVVEQRIEERVDAGERGEAVLAHFLDESGNVARVRDQHVLGA